MVPASSPASSPTPAPALAPPASRELRQPYFLLRTPDRIGNYLKGEVRDALLSGNEPLLRFLAPARLTGIEGKKTEQIVYDWTNYPAGTLRPLEYLLESEIAAFAAAVGSFYARALKGAEKVGDYERGLRKGFRLPDPDREPDAYWVYGPEEDPHLVVLWGAEAKEGSSLPLAPQSELGFAEGQTVLDRLRRRLMPWPVVQAKALELALRPNEPLAKFFVRPGSIKDKTGKAQPVWQSADGKTTYGKGDCRPVQKLSASTVAAFRRAAEAYYAKAAPTAVGVSDFEKQLRRQLVLPDPAQAPEAVLSTGGGLNPILLLPAIPATDPARSLPLTGTDLVPGSTERNLADWLGQRLVPLGMLIGIAGGIAAALVLAAVVYFVILPTDSAAPKLVAAAQDDASPTTVYLDFNEAIDPSSLNAPVTVAGQPRAPIVFENSLAEIATIAPDPANPKRVVVTTATPLQDGRPYGISIVGLRDKAQNAMEPVRGELTYADRTPFIWQEFSAFGEDRTQALLIFNKPVNRTSLQAGNIEIQAADGNFLTVRQFRTVDDLPDKAKVPLAAIVTVDRAQPFQADGLYRITVRDVEDRAAEPNRVADKVGLNGRPDTVYRDIFPPQLRQVTGEATTGRLRLAFNKPLAAASVNAEANFRITDSKGQSVLVEAAQASLEADRQTIVLPLVPARRTRGEHNIAVRGVQDVRGNEMFETTQTFTFADDGLPAPSQLQFPERRTPPPPRRVPPEAEERQFSVEFDVAPAAPLPEVKDVALTRFDGAVETPLNIVTGFSPVGSDGKTFAVTLSRPIGAGEYRLVVREAANIFGAKNERGVELPKFTVRGVSSTRPPANLPILADAPGPQFRGNRFVFATNSVPLFTPAAQNAANFALTDGSGQAVAGARVSAVSVQRRTLESGKTILQWEVTLEGNLPPGAQISARNLERADTTGQPTGTFFAIPPTTLPR